MNRSLILSACAVAMLPAAPLSADDIAPPWWRDKHPNHEINRSTLQQWEFAAGLGNPLAEPGFLSPPSSVDPIAGVEPGSTWIDDDPDSSRQGLWALTEDESAGMINLFISNYTDGPEKKIRIQLTWKPRPHILPPPEDGSPLISAFTNLSLIPVYAELLSERPLAEDWIHSSYLIVVRPNPSSEIITLSGDILVDEVVVDTICPEPGTLLLLGAGVPFLARARRR